MDVIKHGAEVMQEPRSMRELAALHFQGHTEGKLEQNKTLAEKYWSEAAKSGDLWSAWHATLSYLRDGEIDAAVPYLDVVSNSTLLPLKFMALHFKFRLGIGEAKDPVLAGNFLKASADLGNANAQLILAHSYMGFKQGNMEGVEPPGGPDKSAALVYYKAAAANGRLVPKLNAGLLIAQGADTAVTDRDLQCTLAYKELAEVIYAAYPPAHLLFAHARRAFVLGDLDGSRLRFSLLSDAGFLLGHLNAAWLWDKSVTDKLSFWRWYRSYPSSKEGFLYYQRAAVSGHTTSMTELSVRLLKEAEVVQNSEAKARCTKQSTQCYQRCQTKVGSRHDHQNTDSSNPQYRSQIFELQQSAYRWVALAAELGEARAIFDQAYMLQFGVGVEQNEPLARKLYQKLGDKSWPARIAALSWLGLTTAREYFLTLRQIASPLLEALGTAWNSTFGASLARIASVDVTPKIHRRQQTALVFEESTDRFLNVILNAKRINMVKSLYVSVRSLYENNELYILVE